MRKSKEHHQIQMGGESVNKEKWLKETTEYGKQAAFDPPNQSYPRIVGYIKGSVQSYRDGYLNSQELIEEIEALLEGFDQGQKERKERENNDRRNDKERTAAGKTSSVLQGS